MPIELRMTPFGLGYLISSIPLNPWFCLEIVDWILVEDWEPLLFTQEVTLSSE